MKIPFITGEAPEGNYPINWYFLPEKVNGRDAMVMTPGMRLKYDTGNALAVRGLHRMGSVLFAIAGNTLYRMAGEGSETAIGTIASSTGPVQMENNGLELMISDGTYGYIYENGVLSQITDTDFPTPAFLTYQDGYFIVLDKDTENFYISALYDGTSWDALDYATAGARPDKAKSILMDHREIWVFQEDSIRVYYNSGDTDFPFDPVPGGFIETGIGAAHSVVNMDESIFWLDDDFMVRRATGFIPTIISPPQLNAIISGYSNKSDAFAFSYVNKGSTFYVISFETATWAYNALTGYWHQWASGIQQLRHRSSCCVRFDGKYLVGDSESGKIFELDDETYTDDGAVIKSTRITHPVMTPDRVNLFWHQLEIEFESGVGLATGQGSDPQIMLQWSDDKKRTWSNEHWRSMGKAGEYQNRSIWDCLGESRERMFKLEITDPVKRNLIGARANITKGIH
jgi:hypothetical protein